MTSSRGWLSFVAVLALATPAVAHAQTVTGFVRDSAGRPLAGAEVSIEALAKRTLADATGRYLLADIPAGLRLVRARMLGHAAVANLVKLAAGDLKTMDFALERVPLTLDTVVVKDRKDVAGIGFAAMEERRKLGFGKFLDSTFLRKNEHRELRDVMREIPQTYVITAPDQVCRVIRGNKYCYTLPHGMQVAASRRLANRDVCLMEVFLDGVRVQPGSQPGESPPRYERAFDLRTAPIAGLDGVEFYRGASETPMEYSSGSECGVILLWSHRRR